MQYNQYIEYNETNQICRNNLKNLIILTSSGGEDDFQHQYQKTEQLFKNYDECVHVECTMRSAAKILAQKKSFLNQETTCDALKRQPNHEEQTKDVLYFCSCIFYKKSVLVTL